MTVAVFSSTVSNHGCSVPLQRCCSAMVSLFNCRAGPLASCSDEIHSRFDSLHRPRCRTHVKTCPRRPTECGESNSQLVVPVMYNLNGSQSETDELPCHNPTLLDAHLRFAPWIESKIVPHLRRDLYLRVSMSIQSNSIRAKDRVYCIWSELNRGQEQRWAAK